MAQPRTNRYIPDHADLSLRAETSLQACRAAPNPFRTLVPNLITLLALCAGLTAIRSRPKAAGVAVAAIVFAAMLDAIDGRVARMIKGTSRFGAELDSSQTSSPSASPPGSSCTSGACTSSEIVGWIAAMVSAICAAAAARPLQRDDRGPRTARSWPAISSSACRRRPGPSRCCCRSTSIPQGMREAGLRRRR